MTRATAKQDSRLVRNAAPAQRDSRSTADADRVIKPGSTLTAEERRRLLRESEVDEVLPTPPKMPGWSYCWLSTTHSSDTIFNRVRKGWVPVMASEIPGFGQAHARKGGEYDGIVACNEMLLYKIPEQTHNDLMVIYHHAKPNEEEAGIRQKLAQATAGMDTAEITDKEMGNFTDMGAPKTPVFNC